jgi:hypothetical protein
MRAGTRFERREDQGGSSVRMRPDCGGECPTDAVGVRLPRPEYSPRRCRFRREIRAGPFECARHVPLGEGPAVTGRYLSSCFTRSTLSNCSTT